MDFKFLKEYKAKPLIVEEFDLSKDKKKRRKLVFDEDDIRVNHSSEYLKQCKIQVPVFHNRRILPIGLKSKLLDYQLINKGCGFYILVQKIGKAEPKPHDRRHPLEDIDRKNGGEKFFYYVFDKEGDRYKNVTESTFNEQYAEIEGLKYGDNINQLIWDFEDFYEEFWINKKLFEITYNLGERTTTYNNQIDLIRYLKSKIPLFCDYHRLLNIFGDIDDQQTLFIFKQIKELKTRLKRAENYILEHFGDNLNTTIKQKHDYTKGNHYNNLDTFYKRVFDRTVHVIDDQLFFNIGEIYQSRQYADPDVFESDKSRQERLIELKEKVKGKSNFFTYSPK